MKRRTSAGFSLIELLMVLAVAGTLTALAIPVFRSSMRTFQLNSAVTATTGAIQATRFQAIMRGYQYEIIITASTRSYQVYNMPATTFVAVGSAVPITSAPITINQNVTLVFSPNGTVTGTPTNMTFTMTNAGLTKQIVVSGVGNVSVTP